MGKCDFVGFKGVFYHLWSIYSNNSHVGYLAWSSDTILKIDTIRMIQTNFGWNWPCSFKEDDFENSLHQMDRWMTDNDRYQVIAKPNMTIWVKWVKKFCTVHDCVYRQATERKQHFIAEGIKMRRHTNAILW